jgi:hypothetical protein
MAGTITLVHITHCCEMHGCKYGDTDCPVEFGTQEQKYPCQDCGSPAVLKAKLTEGHEDPDFIADELAWSEKLTARGFDLSRATGGQYL